MKYHVVITDFGDVTKNWHVRGLSLAQAWRVSERAARRGVKLYGGSIHHDNWGARGGALASGYRATLIRLDTGI